MADVFLSYSRKDMDLVRKLHDALAERAWQAWVDWQDIPPSAEWLKEIFANIEAADNFLFVISPDSCASEMCRQEVDHAANNHKRMIPVLWRSVDSKDLPPSLAPIQWICLSDDGFETALDSLIRILNVDLDWVRSHTRLLVRAREWELKGRDGSFVLRGMDLQDAIRWQAQAVTINEPRPSELQQQYIRASQQWEAGENERLRLQARRLRRRAWGLAIMLLVAIGAALFASWQQTVARARELAANSSFVDGTDLFAAQAAAATWKWGHTVLPEAEDQLHRAILEPYVAVTLRGHGDYVSSVAWSPDGRRLVTGSADGTAKVWDLGTGKELLTLTGDQGAISSVAWSPNGQRLATGSDSAATVWDARTGMKELVLKGGGGRVMSVAFNPDGNRLATGSQDKTTTVWDIGSRKEFLILRGHTAPVMAGGLTASAWRQVAMTTQRRCGTPEAASS
jgi:hypothetical protein